MKMKSDASVEKKAPGRGGEMKKGNDTNFFSVHGTVPNRAVAADSHLCEDLQQHLITKSQNIRGEVKIPSDFDDFNGYDGLAVKTFNGTPFAMKFGSNVD